MADKLPEILGLIPARGGSKGLPGKNIRPLLGKPLIAHTIESALESKYLNRVIVVTDSDEIAEIAKAAGAEVPFKRPVEVSGDRSHAFAVYNYAASWLAENENYHPDIIANIFCTTAMRSSQDIDACMEMMVRTNCDWCFTVNEIEHHPYRAVTVNEEGRMRPFFDIPREMMWANRQELPEMYRFNGGVIAGKTKHILEHDEYNIDNLEFADVDVRCVKMPVSRALDIDTELDFRIVEMAMQKAQKDSQ
jgi:CMP-N-acetylneuraminic acid synthetase